MKHLKLLIILLLSECFLLSAQPRQILLNDHWTAKRAMDEIADGTQITSPKFQPVGWMEAIVPGTILTTLLHNGLVPDPNFGMNNAHIPDVFNTGRDHYTYWFYRTFELPALKTGEQVWLHFRGINYIAEIYLNGKRINTNTHKGMYLREKYLITPYLRNNKPNQLAVWVAPPDPVGNPNNGQGGDGLIARNVTMQFTAGWDWICSIPDRNTGIWDQVALEVTGAVDVRNSYIEPRVPGARLPGAKQDPAFLKITTEVKNCSGQSVEGTASAEVDGQMVKIKMTLLPYEERLVTFKELELKNPRLWWPNGIGEQPLYPVRISFSTLDGTTADQETIPVGVRETGHTYDPQIRGQQFSVNGQKIFIKGGNWIASDAWLRLTAERYDAEIRHHAGMNMNMIRVWGGSMTERPEFYAACDKYGILVWQDLWISGDCNGEWQDPMKKDSQERRKAYPDDHSLFLQTVTDQVKLLRNHPSLFLWCGGNETYPPLDILEALKQTVFPTLDPKRYFLEQSLSPSLMSNEKGRTGDGPYGILEPLDMFKTRSFPFNPEIGSISIPNFDGLRKIIPQEELQVPRSPNGNGSWAYHKYHSYHEFPDRYGKVAGVEDYCKKAQIVSYDQYRSLQEAFNYKMWEWYTGMLVWKNQNPWTALRGSFYDYYLDYTGGYFGYKHGAAPLHIQLNLNDSSVCIINQTLQRQERLTASVALFDLHGHPVAKSEKTISIASQTVRLIDKIALPKSSNTLFFLRLQLFDEESREVDENFYWLTTQFNSYEALNQLEQVSLTVTAQKNGEKSYAVTVTNPGKETAFFIRIKANDEKGASILPIFLDENYFTLLPGESRKVNMSLPDTYQESPGKIFFLTEGWNSKLEKTAL